jgi:hypothetical protein
MLANSALLARSVILTKVRIQREESTVTVLSFWSCTLLDPDFRQDDNE